MRVRSTFWPVLLLLALTSCGVQRFALRSVSQPADTSLYASIRPEYRPLSAMLTEDTGLPPREGNDLVILPDGAERLSYTLKDWNAVRASLYMEKYRFQRQTLTDTLYSMIGAKAREGVDVRVLVERHAQFPRDRMDYRKLRSEGVDVQEFHPPGKFFSNLANLNRRDHRKLEILDSQLAYLGGRNLADRNFSTWADLDVRITGPVVMDLNQIFMRNWTLAGGREDSAPAAPEKADTPAGENSFFNKTVQALYDGPKDRKWTIRDSYEWTLGQARQYFYVSTPYFTPPASTVQALCAAARRGVDVRIMLPRDCDLGFMNHGAEAYFRELLDAGVQIYLWQGVMHHAKRFLCDDYLSCIGSANLDGRSFFINYEDNLIVYDEETAVRGKEIFLKELDNCRQVSREEVRKWSVFRRAWNAFVRLFNYQL